MIHYKNFNENTFELQLDNKGKCNNIFCLDIETSSYWLINNEIVPYKEYYSDELLNNSPCGAICYLWQFGIDNDISVACCGSSVSAYQIHMLIAAGAKEIIIAFDRQFQEIGDKEFEHLKNNLLRLRDKYKNDVLITFIFDKHMITGYKDSPIDCGKEIFLQLFKERIVL